jgi:tetratricopeptide (TPR) repeat protein
MARLITILIAIAAGMSPAQSTREVQVASPLGAKFFALPDEKGVVAAARKNLETDPKNPELILKLALAQSSIRQYREAVATCTRGLAIAPDNADLLLERGHRELGLREFTRARADLQRAVTLDPKKLDAYYHLGLAHYFLGEFAPSAEAFRHAVDLAPTLDSRINSSNWLYASLRRANQSEAAAQALAQITPEMKNTEPHTFFYLSLLRYFQGKMPESEVVPPEPSRDATDPEPEMRFDTVAYGVGNWYLYNGNSAKAQEYFRQIVKGQVWMTWGFIGAETELVRSQH